MNQKFIIFSVFSLIIIGFATSSFAVQDNVAIEGNLNPANRSEELYVVNVDPSSEMRKIIFSIYGSGEIIFSETSHLNSGGTSQNFYVKFFPPLFENNKKYTSLTDLLNIIPRVGKKIVRTILENVVSKSSRIGRFRQSGEVHRYMHDVYSLTHLLESQGFSSITKIDPYTSAISDWDKYELDVINGQPDGPFALYVEAKV